jgi:hypothetical protein
MDFIERIFGIDPDGGSGILELLLFLIPLWALLVIRWRIVAKRRIRDRIE